MAGSNEQIRIDIVAEDDASKVLEDVADDAEALEKLSPEIEVSADTDKATAGIDEVTDAAQTLSKQDTEIVLRARIDDAKGALKALRDDLDQTADKAQDTAKQLDKVGGDGGGGLQTRGNAIADLTGPLGEASSAASDFAGVFDGLGDIASDVAGKLGASSKLAGQVAGAMGGLGIAVAAGAAVWSLYQEKQRKAREEAEKMIATHRKLTDAIEAGDAKKFGEEFAAAYGKVREEASKAGITAFEFTRFVTGQNEAILNLDNRLEAYRDGLELTGTAHDEANAKMFALGSQILEARDQWEDLNGTQREQDVIMAGIIAGMPRLASATDKATSATKDNTAKLEDNISVQDRLHRTQELTRQGFEKIRGVLDMDQAAANFRTTMEDALFWVRNGATLTDQHIRDLKGAILDVAEYAKYTPIEVRSLLERIDNGEVDAVVREVNHRLEFNSAKATVALEPPTATQYAAMNREISRGIGMVYFTAALNNIRSGAYG